MTIQASTVDLSAVLVLGVVGVAVLGLIVGERLRYKRKQREEISNERVKSSSSIPLIDEVVLIIVGTFLGAVIGFLVRPSLPLIGQLPFDTVISRGSNLTGIDLLAKSAAEESFNYMLIGAIIGGIGAAVWHRKYRNKTPSTVSSPTPIAADASPRNAFCTKCGAALTEDIVFCGACGARRM